MKIQDIISLLEKTAPVSLQEEYDNVGLITGDASWECTGAILSLDATADVVAEAIQKKCNLVVAHHPIVFRGLKKINGKNYVEQTLILAIKHDIAIYAIHTNLDNVLEGVNGKIADKLGLVNRSILLPKAGLLKKLAVFVPARNKDQLLNALFAAGAGHIGNYSECSFSSEGTGSFKAGESAHPHVGTIGKRHEEKEHRIEVVFPSWLQQQVTRAMIQNHPYEEVAYDIYDLTNTYGQAGAGLLGELPEPMAETLFLQLLKNIFNIPVIKHTALRNKPLRRIALCGGAGSFLTGAAIRAGADMYISADIKYHEFFDAENRLVLADIGHYESEQYTTELLFEVLSKNFPNFAVLKTGVNTNPVHYFT